jgi:hypothetical protein
MEQAQAPQVGVEKQTHHAHRDALAVFFANHPYQIVTHELLEQMVGRNYQQRISDARRELQMNIENVPRSDPAGKRLTGDYRYRPEALGRDAGDLVHAVPQDLPIFGDQPGAYRG